jgi:hypothetical protein
LTTVIWDSGFFQDLWFEYIDLDRVIYELSQSASEWYHSSQPESPRRSYSQLGDKTCHGNLCYYFYLFFKFNFIIYYGNIWSTTKKETK